jgi:Na+-driven multidrug efflux pump
MHAQMLGTMLHIIWSFLFVYYFNLGLIGTSMAITSTNCCIFSFNLYYTNKEEGLREALDVSFFDPQVRQNLKEQFSIGIPNLLIVLFDWACFEITTLMAGHIGVNQ